MNSKTPCAFIFALAMLFCAVASVQAQQANGASTNSPSDASTPEHARGLPNDEAVLRQHLASDDTAPAGNANTGGKARPVPGGGAPGSSQGARGAQQEEATGVAAAVKDFVKPLHQEVTNSSVVQAVRQLDAVVSGKTQPDAENGPANSALRNADSAGGAGSRKPDANAAALMWAQFVDDVLPWAVGGAVLGLMGYGGYLWLKLIKLKRLKQGDKRRAKRHSERRSAGRTSSSRSNRSSSRNSGSSIG